MTGGKCARFFYMKVAQMEGGTTLNYNAYSQERRILFVLHRVLGRFWDRKIGL